MKRPGHPPIVLLGALLATTYFISHAVFGTHGLYARSKLIDRSSMLEREISVLEAVRSRLEQDVKALSSDPPHRDMIETVARSTLGLIAAGDRIVLREAPR